MENKIVLGVSVIVGCFIAYVLFFVGMNEQEKAECLTWQEEAKTMPDYFITKWQEMQCDAHSIVVDAPVR